VSDKRDTILIVDDQEINRAILRSAFESSYNIIEAENGEQAVLLAELYHSSLAAMLLDIIMPKLDGYQVLQALSAKNIINEFPVVIITAADSTDNKVKAFDLGASDIISKPFELYVIKRRVENIIELNLERQNQEQIIAEQAAKIRASNEMMIDALSTVIETRSLETGQHIRRIRLFTKVILEDVEKSYPEYLLTPHKIDVISSAASMHDIGKIAIPDSILNKPGRLTPEEFGVMKTHSTKGAELISHLGKIGDPEYLGYAYNIARYHHERWDGRGYPDGLKGDTIPICAQAVGIADCYDALTNDRVYKKALPSHQAITMILNGECGTFSPKLLETLKKVESNFTELTDLYKDSVINISSSSFVPEKETFAKVDEGLDTLQMSQIKYFTLLKYLKCTVAEVDFANLIYHIIYLSSEDFATLKVGGSFKDAMSSFIQNTIHPDDRHETEAVLDKYSSSLFEEGQTTLTREYRIFSVTKKKYVKCHSTIMRLETENPASRKCMIIWEEVEEANEAEEKAQSQENGKPDSYILDVADVHLVVQNDKSLTMDRVDRGLAKFLNYSEEEIQDKFNGSFLALVKQDDRPIVIDAIKEQGHKSTMIQSEFRLIRKDGSVVWVLGKANTFIAKNGLEYLNIVLFDINQSKKAQEDLRLLAERYKIITDLSQDIVFEWDAASDTMSYSSNAAAKLGFVPLTVNFMKNAQTSPHIHPDDANLLLHGLSEVTSKTSYKEYNIRLIGPEGKYRWYKDCLALQHDETGKLLKIVGTISDIDEEKRKQDVLQMQAERDSLTDLYNKMTANKMLTQYLNNRQKDDKAALIILDIDDFKSINDCYGHLFGDTILQDIASELKKYFENEEFIARIGGDEFLILIKNQKDTEAAKKLSADFNEAVQNINLPGIEHKMNLSCSVGIAFCPDDGDSFETLFTHADMALYEAKAKGKNEVAIYDKSTTENTAELFEKNKETRRTTIDSSEASLADLNNLTHKTFIDLYESKNVSESLDKVLKRIGTIFNVSRVYVYRKASETSKPKIFEWMSQNVPYAKPLADGSPCALSLETLSQVADENGVVCYPDVSKIKDGFVRKSLSDQNIQSCLLTIMTRNGSVCGYMGFDDCVTARAWSKEQIDALTLLTKVISIFLN
jgi:diguanylate cyclase (GGDEF)-like protein/PAS domain S-box-containing protein